MYLYITNRIININTNININPIIFLKKKIIENITEKK